MWNKQKSWQESDALFMLFFTVLSCSIMAFIAKDFSKIVTDLWYGFGGVVMEFGRVIEQLPV